MSARLAKLADNWLDSILLRYVNRPFGQAEGIECRDAILAALPTDRLAALVEAARDVVIQRGRYYRGGIEDPVLSVVPRVSLRRLDVASATFAGGTLDPPAEGLREAATIVESLRRPKPVFLCQDRHAYASDCHHCVRDSVLREAIVALTTKEPAP